MRLGHEEMGGQDFLDDGADPRQREMRLTPSTAFALEKAVGDGRQDDVTLPPRQAAAFEVVEPNFVFEFLVLLLDRPTLMREADQLAQGDGGREVDQVIAEAIAAGQFPFAQQPDFGREPMLAPIVSRRDPDRTEAGPPRAIGAIAPRDESPLTGRLGGRPRPRLDGVRVGWQPRAGVPRNTLRSDETPNA
jgi:hypothetical protein